jgi:L-ribulose-5-phosphate 3-epimerase
LIAAINYWSFEHGLSNQHPIAAAARQAKEAGFDAIELAIDVSGVLSTTSTIDECREIRSIVDATGIQFDSVSSGMTWTCSPSHPDPAVRRQAIERHEAALQRVAWLGCKSMLFIPGAVSIPWDATYPFVAYDDAYRWARDATGALLKVAERLQIELCIENVWNGLFYSPLEYRDFIDSFGSSYVGAYFDIGNCMGQHQFPPHWIRLLGERIKRVHAKDFQRSVGNLSGFCDLMEGDQPWQETIQALRQVGYDRTLTAEMIPFAPGRIEKTGQSMQALLKM